MSTHTRLAFIGLCAVVGLSAAANVGCTTTNQIISANENHVTIRPRDNVVYEADRVGATSETAHAHCAQFNKSAVNAST